MAIRVALYHETSYKYDRLVTLSPQIVRLRPAPHTRTPIVSYSLKVEPEGHFINWQQDPQSNWLARLVFPEKTRDFRVVVSVVAEMVTINPFDFFLEASADEAPFKYDEALEHELKPFLAVQESGKLLRDYIAGLNVKKRRTIDFIVDINQRLMHDIKYLIRLEPGVQSCETTLGKRSGSCRDSAALLVQILRHLGLAARFVSGYLIQLAPDQKPIEGPVGPATDFTDLHAWAEVFLPGAGWVGLDPTSGLFAGEGHIPLAATPDPSSAAPITGAVEKCECEFAHHMEVKRIHEDPRTTKPYTREQWVAIETLGARIDEELFNADVRLTMGGEPTFISIDDMESEQWNTAALGPHKKERAQVLLHRMKDRFAKGGLLHFGQGKWYPGEQLPRWAFGCWWRRDGEAIWDDPALYADETKNYGYGPAQAESFVHALAKELGVPPSCAVPGFEDTLYYLWREGTLPPNVDPFDSKLEDPMERERLLRVFTQGLKHVTGYALPLARVPWGVEDRWESSKWLFRQQRLLLIPGDSPMGLRLPLGATQFVDPKDRPFVDEADPTAPGTLPKRQDPRALGKGTAEASRASHRDDLVDDASLPVHRTALCVESREGRVYVFMPPVRTAGIYLELVSAIEATAAALRLPVIIEGYTPPHDARLNHFKITPDPGVIEVNIHPAHSWSELVGNTMAVYEEARESRLCAEKFMLDGRHTGTGGGNHVVLGGATPLDSPFLRRPDLLRSLVAYWNNHPSLSYLFSGLFIGPTSQSPRVDEARTDAVRELELAFSRVSGPDQSCPPWIVDRLFRNLLVDITGNTHRAEFCIDKMYSPDSSTGRLGLLEFRGFEMPPHAEMSLTQQLLLRALVARFWREPYLVRPVRWGTELHDRFMLPHFIEQDFRDVAAETQRAGFPIQAEWFAPHLEFRFPCAGRIQSREIQLELHNAIEPWHVLGEEATAGGTSRYVDSSLERLQVKVSAMTGLRHVVVCNGRQVPLHPTGKNGEFVAGIRYRAWCPPSALHPTIPTNVPLTFDIYDTWNQRAVGGCTYNVAHPGGLSYATYPVNGLEAEARRGARFSPHGHTAAGFVLPPLAIDPEFPFTLDLRKT